MAEKPAEKNKPAAPEPRSSQPPSAPKPAGRRPDLASFAGLAVAFAGIIGGLLLEKGSIQDVAQGTAALIVIGGTLGAVLVTNPMNVVTRAFTGLVDVFFERTGEAPAII